MVNIFSGSTQEDLTSGATLGFQYLEDQKTNQAKGLADIASTAATTEANKSTARVNNANADKVNQITNQLKKDQKLTSIIKTLEYDKNETLESQLAKNPEITLAEITHAINQYKTVGDKKREEIKSSLSKSSLGGILEMNDNGATIPTITNQFNKFLEEYMVATNSNFLEENGVNYDPQVGLTPANLKKLDNVFVYHSHVDNLTHKRQIESKRAGRTEGNNFVTLKQGETAFRVDDDNNLTEVGSGGKPRETAAEKENLDQKRQGNKKNRKDSNTKTIQTKLSNSALFGGEIFVDSSGKVTTGDSANLETRTSFNKITSILLGITENIYKSNPNSNYTDDVVTAAFTNNFDMKKVKIDFDGEWIDTTFNIAVPTDDNSPGNDEVGDPLPSPQKIYIDKFTKFAALNNKKDMDDNKIINLFTTKNLEEAVVNILKKQ